MGKIHGETATAKQGVHQLVGFRGLDIPGAAAARAMKVAVFRLGHDVELLTPIRSVVVPDDPQLL